MYTIVYSCKRFWYLNDGIHLYLNCRRFLSISTRFSFLFSIEARTGRSRHAIRHHIAYHLQQLVNGIIFFIHAVCVCVCMRVFRNLVIFAPSLVRVQSFVSSLYVTIYARTRTPTHMRQKTIFFPLQLFRVFVLYHHLNLYRFTTMIVKSCLQFSFIKDRYPHINFLLGTTTLRDMTRWLKHIMCIFFSGMRYGWKPSPSFMNENLIVAWDFQERAKEKVSTFGTQ